MTSCFPDKRGQVSSQEEMWWEERNVIQSPIEGPKDLIEAGPRCPKLSANSSYRNRPRARRPPPGDWTPRQKPHHSISSLPASLRPAAKRLGKKPTGVWCSLVALFFPRFRTAVSIQSTSAPFFGRWNRSFRLPFSVDDRTLTRGGAGLRFSSIWKLGGQVTAGHQISGTQLMCVQPAVQSADSRRSRISGSSRSRTRFIHSQLGNIYGVRWKY